MIKTATFALLSMLLVLQAHAASTMDAVRSRGSIRLGHRADRIPFSFVDAQQRPTGYTVDLCQRIVELIGNKMRQSLRIEWVAIDSKTRFSFLEENKIDLACGNDTNTRDRQKKYAFSHTTYVAGTRLMAKKSSKLSAWDSLSDQSVAVVANTTGQTLVKDLDTRTPSPMKIVTAPNLQEAWDLLEKDRVVAVGYDDIVLQELAAKSPQGGDAYDFVGGYLSVEPYGIMLRKDDTAFLRAVNEALDSIYESREIYKIYAKWFINESRKVPMSQFFREDIVRPNSYPAYP